MLLDLQLPKVDGPEVLKPIRSEGAENDLRSFAHLIKRGKEHAGKPQSRGERGCSDTSWLS